MDFAAAEDAVQEALLAAATQWPSSGVPDNPRGWLYHVATRRMVDHARSEAARRRREGNAANERAPAGALADGPSAEGDDTLLLLFMCCHPALSPATAVALPLRAVAGLTTAEIARILASDQGEPILARWRVGVGKGEVVWSGI